MFVRMKENNCVEEVIPSVGMALINSGRATPVNSGLPGIVETSTATAKVETAAAPSHAPGNSRFTFRRIFGR